MQSLTPEQIKELSIPYLAFGYKKDEVSLQSCFIKKNSMIATLEVGFLFYEDRIKFHFSSLQASIWIQQLCAMYANWEHPNRGYGYVLESTLKCNTFITKRIFDIKIEMKSKRIKDLTFYRFVTSIDEDKMVCSGKFVYSDTDKVLQI